MARLQLVVASRDVWQLVAACRVFSRLLASRGLSRLLASRGFLLASHGLCKHAAASTHQKVSRGARWGRFYDAANNYYAKLSCSETAASFVPMFVHMVLYVCIQI